MSSNESNPNTSNGIATTSATTSTITATAGVSTHRHKRPKIRTKKSNQCKKEIKSNDKIDGKINSIDALLQQTREKIDCLNINSSDIDINMNININHAPIITTTTASAVVPITTSAANSITVTGQPTGILKKKSHYPSKNEPEYNHQSKQHPKKIVKIKSPNDNHKNSETKNRIHKKYNNTATATATATATSNTSVRTSTNTTTLEPPRSFLEIKMKKRSQSQLEMEVEDYDHCKSSAFSSTGSAKKDRMNIQHEMENDNGNGNHYEMMLAKGEDDVDLYKHDHHHHYQQHQQQQQQQLSRDDLHQGNMNMDDNDSNNNFYHSYNHHLHNRHHQIISSESSLSREKGSNDALKDDLDIQPFGRTTTMASSSTEIIAAADDDNDIKNNIHCQDNVIEEKNVKDVDKYNHNIGMSMFSSKRKVYAAPDASAVAVFIADNHNTKGNHNNRQSGNLKDIQDGNGGSIGQVHGGHFIEISSTNYLSKGSDSNNNKNVENNKAFVMNSGFKSDKRKALDGKDATIVKEEHIKSSSSKSNNNVKIVNDKDTKTKVEHFKPSSILSSSSSSKTTKKADDANVLLNRWFGKKSEKRKIVIKKPKLPAPTTVQLTKLNDEEKLGVECTKIPMTNINKNRHYKVGIERERISKKKEVKETRDANSTFSKSKSKDKMESRIQQRQPSNNDRDPSDNNASTSMKKKSIKLRLSVSKNRVESAINSKVPASSSNKLRRTNILKLKRKKKEIESKVESSSSSSDEEDDSDSSSTSSSSRDSSESDNSDSDSDSSSSSDSNSDSSSSSSDSESSSSSSDEDSVSIAEEHVKTKKKTVRKKRVVEKVMKKKMPTSKENCTLSTGPKCRPLTSAGLRAILAEDDQKSSFEATNWVRRSTRQPSRSAITSTNVRAITEKLAMNDPDMVVLKCKKYISDPDTPCVIIDAILDALERNSNCQALYIQNFNQGMRDEQILHLLRILQLPTCNIWCINIGETYNVKSRTWATFTKGLRKTKITNMYASEHTISSAMKEKIREIIRKNRQKHHMHNDPDNLDVIVKCTHCWWNPINASVLQPYIKQRGYEHILLDEVVQGSKDAVTDQSKI